ncbi:hypothetical protein TNCV_1107411 [Trichonephila clavipes]|nr:hypothetical protein TNCV_1107411 [Trichonephila clavipes]
MAKRDGGQHENKPKTGEGRGNKRRQSESGRDVGGAKHETGRNGELATQFQDLLVSGGLFSDRPNPFPRPLSAMIGLDQS